MTIAAEINALRQMSTPELKAKYREVFSEEPRSNNRDFLWKRIAWRIQELAFGGLSERAKARAKELANIADIRIRAPRGAFDNLPCPLAPTRVKEKRLPMPGTVLVRKYKGQRVEVEVLEKGFAYAGRTYRSLSAVARAVTGSHWNGRLFFGLSGNGDK